MVKICAWIGLALWIGGLTLFIGVVTPVAFKTFGKEEAARFVGVLFPAVDRWALIWSLVTAGSLARIFLNRHFALRSLALELPVGLMVVLTLYTSLILHPHIRELKRKIDLPEFQQTAHQQTIQFAFHRLHRCSVQIHGVILTLGLLSLGLAPRFLR